MKITITNYGKTFSVETDEDVDVESLADMFKGLMVSMGYHPSNVDELINSEYKWFTQEEINDNRQGHLNQTEQKMVDKKVEDWQNDLYKIDEGDMFD
jgi:Tat protein secretion system quality control protein TatD with DNase activity